jgi:hypothetical protein
MENTQNLDSERVPISSTPLFANSVSEAIAVAQKANPNNFKHSEVRKIKRGLMAAVRLIHEAEMRLTLMASVQEGRSTHEEF